MLFSVEQAFVGRDEIGAPLKRSAWEANSTVTQSKVKRRCVTIQRKALEETYML